MRYERTARSDGAFQQPLDEPTMARLCARAFGTASVVAVTELPWSSYNTVFRVDFAEGIDPVVLRVAPERSRQFGVESGLMRNEYTAAPYFTPIADLLPRILFADFANQVVGRDYLVQTLLPGTPVPDALGPTSKPEHAVCYEQVGDVARRVHTVSGPGFGRVAGPLFDTWSAALEWYCATAAEDVRAAGHDAADIDQLVGAIRRHAAVLDEITQPRLLHGDGWTANFLVAPETLELTGVVDWDRAEWGDPLADWSVQRALLRPGSVRESFWTGYGRPRTIASGPRQEIYRARALIGSRLDFIRLSDVFGPDALAGNHKELAEILARIG